MPHTIKPPPPSINENVFAPGPGYEGDEFVTAAQNAMKAGRVAAEAAHEIATAVHQNPMLTEANQHRTTKQQVFKATNGAVARIQSTIERLTAKLAAIDNTLMGPAPSGNHLLMTEIRSTLFNLPAAERRKLIIANIGDKNVATAILRCPPFLAGLSPEEQQQFRLDWQQKAFPAELEQRQQIATALTHLERAGQLLVGYGASLYSGPLLERATAAEARATAAGARVGATAH